MMLRLLISFCICLIAAASATAQDRQPSKPTGPIVVKNKQQISDIQKALVAGDGNKNEDLVAAAGRQMRIAVFHDEKRIDDLHEVHDNSDDIYYVLSGEATLILGGSLVEPNEISPGEWRAKTASGGTGYKIKKGDLVFVPRGTPHQRSVTGKGFSMILIKIFQEDQQAAN